MAVSAFQKVLNRLFRQFALRNGREPQTPKEWMDLQNEAVQFFNRTKGVPPGPQKPPFQGWTPKVIPGGKKEGIESLLKSGDVKKGVAPKTTKETLKAKKDKHILLKDSEEGIARIKRENKEAIERFKEKNPKYKTVEDFRDEGDWDPGGMASGGRIAMAGGGALFKFIEQLFIKASNDIRLGRGKWKGLDQKQRIVQHDNLTKKVTEFQKTGKLPEGTEQYFGVHPEKAFKEAQAQKYADEMDAEMWDAGRDAVDSLTGDKEVLKRVKMGQKDAIKQKVIRDERGMLKQKYPGIADELVEKILIDDNPQRKADVMTTIDQYMKLKEIGKSEAEAYDIITKSFDKKIPTKHGEGGRISNQSGGLAYMLGEPTYMKAGGGQVGHGPWTMGQAQQQPQQQPQAPMHHAQGQPNPMKMPQGIPSAAPRNMDPRVMQQQMMQKAMMGQGRQGQPRVGMMYGGDPGFAFEYGGSWADWHDSHRNQMPVEDYIQTKLPKERLPFRDSAAGGGRIGFGLGSMSRRAFMKLMAGVAAVPFVGKGVSKVAPKAIPKVTEEVIKRGADGMPKYVTDLIEVVKAKGTKDIIEGFKRSDYSNVHRYKGVEVIEDGAGNIKIKSDKSGVATDPYTGKTHEGISQENHIQIEKGQMQVKDEGLETQKSFQEPDEYFEGTVYPDMDGKMKDMQEGLDEAVHLDFKKIADEVDTLIIKKSKKASGGRVPLGGGGIIKVLKKALKKFKNVHDVSNAKIENYIMDQGYKLGKYYKKNPGKGLSHSTAVGTGVLISRHLDRQKRGKKASGGLAHMLGE